MSISLLTLLVFLTESMQISYRPINMTDEIHALENGQYYQFSFGAHKMNPLYGKHKALGLKRIHIIKDDDLAFVVPKSELFFPGSLLKNKKADRKLKEIAAQLFEQEHVYVPVPSRRQVQYPAQSTITETKPSLNMSNPFSKAAKKPSLNMTSPLSKPEVVEPALNITNPFTEKEEEPSLNMTNPFTKTEEEPEISMPNPFSETEKEPEVNMSNPLTETEEKPSINMTNPTSEPEVIEQALNMTNPFALKSSEFEVLSDEEVAPKKVDPLARKVEKSEMVLRMRNPFAVDTDDEETDRSISLRRRYKTEYKPALRPVF